MKGKIIKRKKFVVLMSAFALAATLTVSVSAAIPQNLSMIRSQKTDSQKTDSLKSDSRKTDNQKTDSQKTDSSRLDSQKTDSSKTNNLKVDGSKADTPDAKSPETDEIAEALYTPEDFMFMGVIWYEDIRFTWYSERILPGPGLDIPGRHADEQGYICDEDDFICVASRDLEKGTEVETPFGKKGKVYDWCAISGTLDIYVNW